VGEELSFKTETFDPDAYPTAVAATIAEASLAGGSLVLTGGTTAEKIYPVLAAKRDWTGVTFAFSDERCVGPDDPASNYGMARRLLLDAAEVRSVHRMKGELEPSSGAADYSSEIAPLVHHGFDLLLLGMGADAHVGALYPGSPALRETAFCAAVDRPDGMKGLTLTPPAMLSARKVLLLVTGEAKRDTVARALSSDEDPETCPVRLLASHPDVTFLLDRAATPTL
jgi:6-phosphogluconolactonase